MRFTAGLALATRLAIMPATAGAQQTQDTARADTGRTETARTERSGVETGVIPPAAPNAQTAVGEISNPETARIRFIDAQGIEVGTATVTQTSRGVLVKAELRGLPPGEHGFHFHQTGQCEAPSFRSAGDHYAPLNNPHGYLVRQGPHAGDMPNVQVLQSGLAQVEIYNPSVSLAGGTGPLLDADGSALVIHAQPDDYRSQPSGEAGDRIVCAVISR